MSCSKTESGLAQLYQQLPARDAKWLTRLVLKNYQPVTLDPRAVYSACHPVLPSILKVQDDFAIASRSLRQYHLKRAESGDSSLLPEGFELRPTLGVKVGRQPWFKGRSIKHCLDMSFGRMSCEGKIDGEYCQIHVDLSKGQDCIQIFSKSGKDSTRDRAGLHSAIRTSLQIGEPSCMLKKGCILEGELVVCDERNGKILDFHKIRKHVSRSGSFLGTKKDSQAHSWERLMIIYFDLLAIDDEPLLSVKHSERFRRLRQLIFCKRSVSALVKQEVIDCTRPEAAFDLRRAFARCIAEGSEGLVLKPDDPYFDLSASRRPFQCGSIKLKKEYVGSFGDVGDFAVVGSGYDATIAKKYGLPGLKWTHFYIGCLDNKERVLRWGNVPEFTVTNVVQLSQPQMKFFTSYVNPWSVPPSENDSIRLNVAPGVDNGNGPSLIFINPPVFDIRCFSFDKAGNTGFWSPRFPAVSKIHCDRTYTDAITFEDLQEMAKTEKETPHPRDSEDLLRFIAALEQGEPRNLLMDETSQSAASTVSAPMTASSLPYSSPQQPEANHMPRALGTLPYADTDPLTPPTSSDTRPPCLTQNPISGRMNSKQRRKLKRSLQQLSECSRIDDQQKKRRHASNDLFSSSNPGPVQRPTREPLADITLSSRPREEASTSSGPGLVGSPPARTSPGYPQAENQVLRPSSNLILPKDKGTSSHAASANYPGSSTVNRQRDHFKTQTPALALGQVEGPKECVYCPKTCAFKGMSFLLSPCISQMPYLTENLLSAHGVAEVVLEPEDWKKARRLSRASTSSSEARTGVPAARCTPGPGESRRPRLKKIVLVESRRKEATVAFLQKVKQADLRRRGDREFVLVFDWRILEVLTKEETTCRQGGSSNDARFDMKSAGDIWKRYWIGLA